MTYTFGAGATDRFAAVSPNSILGSGLNGLFWCWFNASTLTAGRCITGWGAQARLAIAPTTSELVFESSSATTRGVHTTSGAGIVTGQWYFVALLYTLNSTGPVQDAKIWLGTIDTPPVSLSISQTTAPVGSFNNLSWDCIGNANNGGSLAFQGDIGTFGLLACGQSVGTNSNPLFLGTNGSIAANEESLVRERIVIPAWRGELSRAALLPGLSQTTELFTADLNLNEVVRVWRQGTAVSDGARTSTVTGATLSQARPPRANAGVVALQRAVRR